MAWYWWLLVGILIGWLLSTLIEWLWFRRKRMEVRDERVAELESALRAASDDGPSSIQGSGVALTDTAAAVAGVTAPLADRNVTLTAPDLDTAADTPDLDTPVADLPDVSAEMDGPIAVMDTAADTPDLDTPAADLPDTPDVSAKLDVAKTGLGAAALAVGATASAGAAEVAPEVADTVADDVADAPLTGLGSVPSANTNYPDDLTEILGIGRAYETRLYRAGIFTWDQIANMTVSALEEATEAIDAANVADWPAQAQSLALANDRIGARYHGPMPDKLSQIKGIGEGAEQQLYRAGIFTFAQLAATTADDLAAALPTSRGDFSDWIVQAAGKG